jgi:hypothetical protein
MRRKTIQHNDEQSLSGTKLESAMRRYAEDSAFAPRFAERVQCRIQAASPSNSAMAQSLLKECAVELAWAFRRAAVVGVAVTLLLAWYNASQHDDWSLVGAFGLSSHIHENGIAALFE